MREGVTTVAKHMRERTGAERLVETAVAAGVEICFANPGTTEMPLVAALDSVPGVRGVLCLFEGVCAGAADGWARMTGRPAMTLLHLGPGFANGIANLHNARRARSPILNVIGDHATWHRSADPPLACDIESLARPVSRLVSRVEGPGDVATATARSVAAARSGGVATLIVPHDVQGARSPEAPRTRAAATAESPTDVAAAATLLRHAPSAALHLGGSGLSSRGLAAAGRVAAATGARLFCDTFPARLERGAGHPAVERLPYFPEQVLEAWRSLDAVVFAGARPPVSFFGYPGIPSTLVPERCDTAVLAPPGADAAAALEALADLLGAPEPVLADVGPRPRPTGALTPERIAAAVAAVQPADAIVVDESLTAGVPYFAAAARTPPHSYLALTGGAIGQGLPSATGAALACPERPVLALQADGSGMYTLQSLHTQAREGLDVTNLVFSNHGYRILSAEMARAGMPEGGAAARTLTTFDADWVSLARGFGVPGVRVTDAATLCAEIERALAEPGPHLVEMAVA